MKNKNPINQQKELNYLLEKWQQFADVYASSEQLIYEWLNDLDSRRLLDELIPTLSFSDKEIVEQKLEIIDAIVKEKTFEINECVWGKKVEKKNNYNRKNNWYYYILNQALFDYEVNTYTKKIK